MKSYRGHITVKIQDFNLIIEFSRIYKNNCFLCSKLTGQGNLISMYVNKNYLSKFITIKFQINVNIKSENFCPVFRGQKVKMFLRWLLITNEYLTQNRNI